MIASASQAAAAPTARRHPPTVDTGTEAFLIGANDQKERIVFSSGPNGEFAASGCYRAD
jgi:hypothetical protein